MSLREWDAVYEGPCSDTLLFEDTLVIANRCL